MSGISGDAPCPSCQAAGRDSTGNHLMVFDGGNTYCNRCHYKTNREGAVIDSGNLDEQDVPMASKVPESNSGSSFNTGSGVSFESGAIPQRTDPKTLPSDKIRDISKKTVSHYGVTVEYDPATRSIIKHHYPVYAEGKFLTWKTREVDTKKFFSGKTKGCKLDFFGQWTLRGKTPKKILITEGELDAMAAHEMLKGTKIDIACVSLPTGANTHAIKDHLDWLKKCNEIYLCLDQDKVGKAAAEAIWKLIPSVKVMEFSEKDADEMLTGMKTMEFTDAFLNASKWKPRTVIGVQDIEEDISVPLTMGLDYPWDTLTTLTCGLRTQQLIGIGAAPKAGKTTLVKAIQQKIMFDHKTPIGIFSLEESAASSRRKLVGYIMNERIWVPGATYDGAEAQRISDTLKDKAYFYDHNYYDGKWSEIESQIRYFESIGIKYMFIDPLSGLVSHLSASDGNRYLSDAMYSMSKLVQTLDITIFHVNHLNSGDATGKNAHEVGGRVYASQFTGSRAQWRFSTDIWGMERDQHATGDDKNKNLLRILGDRDIGNTGRYCVLKYDPSTGRLEEEKKGGLFV